MISTSASGDTKSRESQLRTTLQRLNHACRQFGDFDVLLDDLATIVEDAAGASRLLAFLKYPREQEFQLKYGMRDQNAAACVVYRESDPLPVWLQFHAHMVTRATLSSIAPPQDRRMLTRVLDTQACDVLVPLWGRHKLLGWLLLGRHVSGGPYTDPLLADLTVFAEHMAITLENALLHRLVEEHWAMTQAMIDHLPDGVVAIDDEGKIRWANRRISSILSLSDGLPLNQPAYRLGDRLADALEHCLGEDAEEATYRWEDQETFCPLSVTTRRLEHGGHSLGAMAVVRDLSGERRLQRRAARIERRAFYQGLAKAIGHEVGNACCNLIMPLDALRKSAGADHALLAMADAGTARLAELPKLFIRFANMPDPQFEPCDLRDVIHAAIRKVYETTGRPGRPVHLCCPTGVPRIEGDGGLLVECFSHILENAVEALAGSISPAIGITVEHRDKGQGRWVVTFADDGPGFDADVLESDPFSPFSTSKVWPGGGLRHIGLGLPVAERIALDHGGRVAIRSGRGGSGVSVSLPVSQPALPCIRAEDRATRP